MRVVEQALLQFQQGNSDKVYEVDLIEVGPDEFVVNFRYGRRGSGLRDGSKTPLPVDRDKAKQIFDDLVGSKTKKGYQHAAGAPSPTQAAAPVAPEAGGTQVHPRVAAILKRLTGERADSSWSVDRAIWRAALIGIPEASGVLVSLFGASPVRDYCLLAALGRCGGQDAIVKLKQYFKGSATNLDNMNDRMAVLALLEAGNDQDIAQVHADLVQKLPVDLQSAVQSGSSEDVSSCLSRLTEADPTATEALDILYLLNTPVVRDTVLNWVREAKFSTNSFYRIRHIFKAAEYRRDGEVYGIISRLFEKRRANFNKPTYMWRDQFYARGEDGQYRQYKTSDLKGPNAKLAYSTGTRQYMRKRCWRSLDQLGSVGSSKYVPMAVGVLLAYTDEDAARTYTTSHYRWDPSSRRYNSVSTWWGKYAQSFAFNNILYKNSSRYEPVDRSLSWRCKPGYNPNEAGPSAAREDAYPELWNQQPQGTLHLISESRCEAVHEFAVSVLRSNMTFALQLDAQALSMVVSSPYEVSARLGFDLVNRKLADGTLQADTDVLLALAGSVLEEARQLLMTIMRQKQQECLADDRLLAGLLLSKNPDVQDFVADFIHNQILRDEHVQAIMVRVIAVLVGLTRDDSDYAQAVGAAVVKALEPKLALISMQVVLDLINHPVAGVQELGADILVCHRLPASRVPDDILRQLLHSEHERIRTLGMRILSQFSDTELLSKEALLAALASSKLDDVRSAAQPLITRLARYNRGFGERVTNQFLSILLRARLGDEILSDVAKLVKDGLAEHLDKAPSDVVWRLLHTNSRASQDVGGELLKKVDPKELELKQIVKLASHDVRSVREASWAMMKQSLERIQADMIPATKILDAEWDDSRAFAFEYFENSFDDSDFTPEVLIAVCDSVRDDVQQFGRKLLTIHFNSRDALEYLCKLSEHPAEGMQLFVSSFVERTLQAHPDKLQSFDPFFRTCLTRVSRGRTTRQRILNLLAQVAGQDRDCAAYVSGLLGDLSATVSVEVKALCLRIMVAIQKANPDISTPMTIKKVEVKDAV